MSEKRPGESTASNTVSFELRFNPNIDLITVVRRFVEDFYRRVLRDADSSSRVALATHELLENAAKYSVNGDVRLCVEVELQQQIALVRTINHATQQQIERLRACFEEIVNARDVTQYYREMLRRTGERRSGSGGIGLARIWAESEMPLRLVVNGDEVEIHAHGPIDIKR